MAQDDVSLIVDAIRDSSRSESSKVKKDLTQQAILASEYGGLELVNQDAVKGGASFMVDGGLESCTTFQVNPAGWTFSGSSGFVFDYRYQPADARNVYLDSGTSGAPVVSGATLVSDFIWRDLSATSGLYVVQSEWVSPSSYRSLSFNEVPVSSISNSMKGLLVQNASTGTTFSVAKASSTISYTKNNTFFFEFDLCAFDGYIDTSVFTKYSESSGIYFVTATGSAASGYIDSTRSNRTIPFSQSTGEYSITVAPRLNFYDASSGLITYYEANTVSLVRYSGWKSYVYSFKAPEYTSYLTVEFIATCPTNRSSTSFVVDGVSILEASIAPTGLVGPGQILPGAVGTNEIAERAVTTSKLADDVVTISKLAGSVSAGGMHIGQDKQNGDWAIGLTGGNWQDILYGGVRSMILPTATPAVESRPFFFGQVHCHKASDGWNGIWIRVTDVETGDEYGIATHQWYWGNVATVVPISCAGYITIPAGTSRTFYLQVGLFSTSDTITIYGNISHFGAFLLPV